MDLTPAIRGVQHRSRARIRRALRKAGFALSVLVIVSPAVLVFLWMLSLSLKNEIDNLAYPPVFIPNPPTFANFLQVFEQNEEHFPQETIDYDNEVNLYWQKENVVILEK